MQEKHEAILELPNLQLDLSFFLEKGSDDLTVEQFLEILFKDSEISYKQLTEPEKIFCVVKAIESLDLVAPLEFECPKCGSSEKFAVNIAKTMNHSGKSLKQFQVKIPGFSDKKAGIFEFFRPLEFVEMQKNEKPNLATLGLFMLQWISGHNQGPDFMLTKLELSKFIKLLEAFTEKLFKVEFSAESECSKCKHHWREDFGISMEEIVQVINQV